jgi:hypothetical protein
LTFERAGRRIIGGEKPFLSFAAIQRIESKQDLTGLAPQDPGAALGCNS